MTTEATRRAVSKFLAEDKTDLNKLHFLRRLASLAGDLNRRKAVSYEERESALRLVAQQSPHRSWNKTRFSEARLVSDCYLDYDGVVAELSAYGKPFTWRNVLPARRQRRRGAEISLKPRDSRKPFRTALENLAKRHGLAVESFERSPKLVRVTLAKRKVSYA